MVQARQIVGIFRDRGQARLAVAEALRWGLDVHIPDALAEGAHAVHVVERNCIGPRACAQPSGWFESGMAAKPFDPSSAGPTMGGTTLPLCGSARPSA